MNNSITTAIARLFTSNGSIAGVGFLVSTQLVLTQAGVVHQALELSPDDELLQEHEVLLDFPFLESGKTYKARLKGDSLPRKRADFVELELTGAPPQGSQPHSLILEGRTWDEFFPAPRSIPPVMSSEGLDENCRLVALSINKGRLGFFLGAGANRCDRPPDENFKLGKYLPDGRELANHLAEEFSYPRYEPRDLLRVSQYITLKLGSDDLYEGLHAIFASTYEANSVHRFLARLPAKLKQRGVPHPYQLIITTNYDDALEDAFYKAGESYHLVTYIAESENRGRFLHRRPDGQETLIKNPNDYDGLPIKDLEVEETIILKIHGAVNRADGDKDSYVITEDDYIRYLARRDMPNPVPSSLEKLMRRNHLLFLGYSLRDWNLRVILFRIWEQRKLSKRSWAIQLNPDELECDFWKGYDVNILNVELARYVAELDKRL